jgi:hypothetical protein
MTIRGASSQSILIHRRIPSLIILLGAIGLFVASQEAVAVPVEFGIELTVTNVNQATNGCAGPHTFCPVPQVGDTYFGVFAVQDDLLTQTGNNLPGTLTEFSLQIENLVWDPYGVLNSLSTNDVFAGFRGPIPGEQCIDCLGAPAPGFDVANGTIFGMAGGVYGSGDAPFVDFLSPTQFAAMDNFSAYVTGTMDVSRIPEPSSLFLLTSGFAGLGGITWRRNRRR